MKTFFWALSVSILFFTSCKNEPLSSSKITATQLQVSDSISQDTSITKFIAPYKSRLDKQMDSVLAYAPKSLLKSDGAYNTALGNMMADAVYELSNPIFKKRTKQNIDAVLLNHGGIRSSLNQGDVTMRSAYELMPFENSVVVLELSGKKVNELIDYLITEQRAHPISGMQLILNDDDSVKKATINGKEIDPLETYFIATNDYLQNGGDRMYFFKNPVSALALDYKIRPLLIDYFSKYDTIAPVQDKRFIKE